MRIVALTCLWKRPGVSRSTLRRAANVARELNDIDLVVLCVGSEGEDSRELAEEHGALYLHAPNEPLGAKWQAGLWAAQLLSPDHLFIFGSDDWFTSGLVRQLVENGAPAQGVRQAYVRSPAGEFYRWDGYGPGPRVDFTCGSGRLIDRKTLDKVNWQLWPLEAKRSLDQAMQRAIAPTQIEALDTAPGSALLAVKSRTNIWPFVAMEGVLRPCGRPTEFPQDELADLDNLGGAS